MIKQSIKMFVMDVDGTLTDGKIYMGVNGEICKAFNIKDGYGISRLIKCHIVPVIITGRRSEIVSKRAAELGILEVHQGITDKASLLKKIAEKYDISMEQVAYIGDDCNDLEVMKIVGLTYAPADAAIEVREYVDVVMKSNGGEGAVREAVDNLLFH